MFLTKVLKLPSKDTYIYTHTHTHTHTHISVNILITYASFKWGREILRGPLWEEQIKNESKLVKGNILQPVDSISIENSKAIQYNHSAQLFLPSGGLTLSVLLKVKQEAVKSLLMPIMIQNILWNRRTHAHTHIFPITHSTCFDIHATKLNYFQLSQQLGKVEIISPIHRLENSGSLCLLKIQNLRTIRLVQA